jgi:hypothetical protein
VSDKEKSSESAVTAILASDDTKALVADYTELGIDALLEDGIAKNIPIIGTIVGIAKVGVGPIVSLVLEHRRRSRERKLEHLRDERKRLEALFR